MPRPSFNLQALQAPGGIIQGASGLLQSLNEAPQQRRAQELQALQMTQNAGQANDQMQFQRERAGAADLLHKEQLDLGRDQLNLRGAQSLGRGIATAVGGAAKWLGDRMPKPLPPETPLQAAERKYKEKQTALLGQPKAAAPMSYRDYLMAEQAAQNEAIQNYKRVAASVPVGQNVDAGLYQRSLIMARKRLGIPDKWEPAASPVPAAPPATTVTADTGNGELFQLVKAQHGENVPAEVQQAIRDAEGGNPEALQALKAGGWLPADDGDGPDAENEQESLLELLGPPGQ